MREGYRPLLSAAKPTDAPSCDHRSSEKEQCAAQKADGQPPNRRQTTKGASSATGHFEAWAGLMRHSGAKPVSQDVADLHLIDTASAENYDVATTADQVVNFRL